MRPAVLAQLELTPEMLAVLDDRAVRQRRSDAVVERSRISGLACDCDDCLAHLRDSIARLEAGHGIVVEIDFDDEETP